MIQNITQIKDSFFECLNSLSETPWLFTNLQEDDFSIDEIRDLYNRRWGIETSFRDIKYATGMLFFHSRKKQLVLQEIYAKLILYNFSEAITHSIVLQKKEPEICLQHKLYPCDIVMC